MDRDKRIILVREIEHWRRSKVLPEHYCDFLLNLYQDEETEQQIRRTSHMVANSNWNIWMVGSVLVLLTSLIVLYFNSFPFPMQISIIVIGTAVLYGIGIKMSERMRLIAHLLAGAGSLLMLGGGLLFVPVELTPFAAVLFVTCCCVIWIGVGLAGRMPLFHFCGWLGLLLVYASILHAKTELSWIGAQFSWLPIGMLFGWSGWLFHRRNKEVGRILLLIAFCLWWMPELYAWYTGVETAVLLQAVFFIKLLMAACGLFVLRKRWIEWVV